MKNGLDGWDGLMLSAYFISVCLLLYGILNVLDGVLNTLDEIQENTRPTHEGMMIPTCGNPWPGFDVCWDIEKEEIVRVK